LGWLNQAFPKGKIFLTVILKKTSKELTSFLARFNQYPLKDIVKAWLLYSKTAY
jgi:hypothetical protein